MTNSFSEQIAALYGKEPIQNKKDKGFSRRPRSEVLQTDPQSRSTHLDDLHYCLKDISEGATKELARIPDLAFLVGKSLLIANPKAVEKKFVDRAFDEILNIQDPDKVNVREQLLSAAALAYSGTLRKVLCDALVNYYFAGYFDKSGRFGKLSRKEVSYILKRVTVKKYQSTLDEAVKKRQEIVDRANSALRQDEENRLKNSRAAKAQETLLLKKIKSIFSDLKESPYFEIFDDCNISREDCRLITAWTNQNYDNINGPSDLVNQLSEEKIRRLWSARLGELAALKYFGQFSNDVQDVSLTQIENRQKDWITHDLFADDVAYDVKNSRRSFSSRESYSEHCVPEFKQERRHNSDVVIVGVLSDYLTSQNIRQEQNGESEILGTVNALEIRTLCHWLDRNFSGVLDTSILGKSKFLPGWIFEYPALHQPGRNSGLEQAKAMLREIGTEGKQLPLIKWMASFEDNPQVVAPYLNKESDEIIWRTLRSADAGTGLSKRAVFLAILGVTLQESLRVETSYQPSDWRDWIFSNKSIDLQCKYLPLGMIDRGQYIENLIKMLQIIWDNAKLRLFDFRYFKLIHPSILKGQDVSGAWYTLIAYCGGWRSNPVAKCGKTPIHMGNCNWCDICQHLICLECSHCSNGCQATKP